MNLKVFALGSPRFNNINLNECVGKNELYKKLQINPLKKTILWLPGHSDSTSVLLFAHLVASVQVDYNVILKPHPMLYREVNNLENIVRSLMPTIKIVKDINNIEIFPIADFVCCDYGGSVFTAIAADKNVILFNSAIRKDLIERWIGLDSPEIEIRDRIINFKRKQEKEFVEALCNNAVWEKQKEIRKQIRKEFFMENENAARDITDLLRQIMKDAV